MHGIRHGSGSYQECSPACNRGFRTARIWEFRNSVSFPPCRQLLTSSDNIKFSYDGISARRRAVSGNSLVPLATLRQHRRGPCWLSRFVSSRSAPSYVHRRRCGGALRAANRSQSNETRGRHISHSRYWLQERLWRCPHLLQVVLVVSAVWR